MIMPKKAKPYIVQISHLMDGAETVDGYHGSFMIAEILDNVFGSESLPYGENVNPKLTIEDLKYYIQWLKEFTKEVKNI